MSTDGVILVMGVTGAGKSYFVNQLKSRGVQEEAKEGHSLRSGSYPWRFFEQNIRCVETTRCQAVQIFLDDEDDEDSDADGPRSVTIVDTPGFDDTERSDAEVFQEITEFLSTQHALGIPLRGVLYLHKITDNRVTGSSRTYLGLLEPLLGTEAMNNVILVTTMWYVMRGDLEGQGMRREGELMNDYWRPLIDKGAIVSRFSGSPESAFSIVSKLAAKEPVVLKLQEETIDSEKGLRKTAAGQNLLQRLETTKVEYTVQLMNLEQEIDEEAARGNKLVVKAKEKESAEVRDLIKGIERSMAQLDVQPGPRIKQKIAQLKARGLTTERAVGVLATLLNITLFVVRVAVGV
ncbi:hypothetical protein QBC35DRAFT_445564 [Podospora australis]|uniref:G domain-containing protein n=1 Tax=Podospora australis TaxID=1536484 RepID=A0AAN6WHJ7_9PEZI|nr:hypothetical protein QBC35DRAFT_445564 [Podospora australis]